MAASGGRIAGGGGLFAGGPFATGLIAGGPFASGLNAATRNKVAFAGSVQNRLLRDTKAYSDVRPVACALKRKTN